MWTIAERWFSTFLLWLDKPSSTASRQHGSTAARQHGSTAARQQTVIRQGLTYSAGKHSTGMARHAFMSAGHRQVGSYSSLARTVIEYMRTDTNTWFTMMNDDDTLDQSHALNSGVPPNAGEGFDGSRARLLREASSSRVLVPTSDGSIYLPYEGIVRLQADGSYTHIHTDKGERLMTCKGIGLLHKQLPMEWFHRCHNTHVINLKKVHKLLRTGGCRVQMLTGDVVEVSRRKWRELQDAMSSLRS